MHISLPVFYKINTRLKHHRNYEDKRVYQYANFDLTEISDEEAPIAIKNFDRNNKPYTKRVSDPVYRRHSETTEYPTKTPNPTGILRHHDNALWYPEYGLGDNLLTTEDWTPFNPKNEENFHEIEKRYWDLFFDKMDDTYYKRASSYSKFDEDEHRNIQSSTFQEAYDSMARDLKENVIIVDGYIYTKTPEPIFAVTNFSNHIGITTLFSPLEKLKSGKKVDFFKLDRYDDMIQHVERMIDLKQSGENLPEELSRLKFISGSKPDILIPGLLNFKDDEYTMIRAAKSLLSTASSELKHLDRETVNAWFDLKEELEISDNSDNIGKAFFNFHTIISEKETLTQNENSPLKGYAFRYAIQNNNYALNRWHSKPIDLDIDFDNYNF